MAVINPVRIGGSTPEISTGWQRPSDWLELPEVLPTEEKVVGLAAVYEDDINYVGLRIFFDGQFQVDWGDGSAIEIYNNSNVVYHYYNYDDLDASTLCSRGYRQAIFTITPVNSGDTFTRLIIYHSPININYLSNQILDIKIEGSFTQLVFGSGGNGSSRCYMLEQVETHSPLTNCSNMFAYCWKLQSIKGLDTSNVEDFSLMFYFCYLFNQELELDFSSATNLYGFMYYCQNYNKDINIIAPNCTSFRFAFNSCLNIQNINIGENICTNFGQLCTASSVEKLNIDCSHNTSVEFIFGGSVTGVMNFNIREIDIICGAVNNMGYDFNYESAKSIRLRNMPVGWTYVNLKYTFMKREALIQLFDDLYDRTGESAGSLSLTNALYYDDLTPTDLAIATDKNWTIVN